MVCPGSWDKHHRRLPIAIGTRSHSARQRAARRCCRTLPPAAAAVLPPLPPLHSKLPCCRCTCTCCRPQTITQGRRRMYLELVSERLIPPFRNRQRQAFTGHAARPKATGTRLCSGCLAGHALLQPHLIGSREAAMRTCRGRWDGCSCAPVSGWWLAAHMQFTKAHR